MIKAWIKCGTDRGLQRAVLLLRALALNRINSNEENTNFNDKDTEDGSSATIFDRIARWGTSLLSTDGSIGRQNVEFRPGNEAKTPNANYPQIVGIGIANRLNYLAQMKPTKMTAPSNNEQIPVGLHSRMSMISSSFQSKDAHDTANGEQRSDPVGPLPFIEPDIIPDITTFRLLIKGGLSFLSNCAFPSSVIPHSASISFLNSFGTSRLYIFCTASRRFDPFTGRILL